MSACVRAGCEWWCVLGECVSEAVGAREVSEGVSA